jgi:ABC-type nitrate/sulfonate/bicarbonate transport system substrate-binding protein
MCDEPFATRMESEGLAFKLFSTGNPDDLRGNPGLGFLRAVLVGAANDVGNRTDRAARMVAVVRRTLDWMASHGPVEMADALTMQGAERESFLRVAELYPRQYSRDGRFSTQQLTETELFFRTVNADLPKLGTLRWADMVQDRWAGRKP